MNDTSGYKPILLSFKLFLMKKLNSVFLALVFSLAIITLNSCSKEYYDDDFDTYVEEEGGQNNDDDYDGNDDQGNQGDGDYIASYQINGDNISKIDDNNIGQAWMQDELKHREMFEKFTQLIPADQRGAITQFQVIDGQGGLYGYVYPLNADLSEWAMGLAIDIAYAGGVLDADGEISYTIIHEFGHVLTLSNKQLNAGNSNCSTYNPGEGCSHQNSYINLFYNNYWNDIFDEHQSLSVESFYEKYKSRFVTDYAATNPAEDIAESFTKFVINNNKANGNTIADKKVNFMYDFDNLISLRDYIKLSGNTLKKPKNYRCNHSHKKNGRIAVSH